MSMFEVSEGVAKTIHTAGNILVVVGAVFGVLGAIGVFWGGGVRDRFAAIRLSDNTTATAKANADAARANERAASLEKDTATARLELERLKGKLAWRTISKEDEETFVQLVASAPKSKISFEYLTNNEECASFAMQLADLLRKAGYDAPASFYEMRTVMPFGGALVGVKISVKDKNDQVAAELQKGLQTIGIEAPGLFRENQEERILLEVGAKPSG